MSKMKKFKKKHPKFYETLKVISALFGLTAFFVPVSMFADSYKVANIHSSGQINTFQKLLKIKDKSPIIYNAISNNYKIDFRYCISKLEGLDLHDSGYFECKKIANAIKKEFDNLDL